MTIYKDTEFIIQFFKDDDSVAISVQKYALMYDKMLQDRSIRNTGKTFKNIKTFVILKIAESGENLELLSIPSHYPLVLGTVLAHRLFYNWLLTQPMT